MVIGIGSMKAKANGYYLRGNVYFNNGDFDNTVTDYTEAIRIDPMAAGYSLRGSAYKNKGNYDKAIANYTEAIRLEPTDVDHYGGRGEVYEEKGDIDNAIADYTEAIRLEPNNATGYEARGRSHARLGHVQEAISDYEKCLELDPSGASAVLVRDALKKLSGDKPIYNYEELAPLVISMFKKDGSDAVFSYLDNCIEETPNYLAAYQLRGEMLMEVRKDLRKALADFERAITINPNDAETYFLRGLLYDNSNEISKAINDYSKTIELNANHVTAYNNRANQYLKTENFQKALGDYTKAIQLSPDNTMAHYNRGLVYINANEFAKAIEDYNNIVGLGQEKAESYEIYVDALAKRGLLHSELGHAQEAIRDFEKFLELDPNNGNAAEIRERLVGLRRFLGRKA
jgi:tetratricopeptide (TPR) repeat protein